MNISFDSLITPDQILADVLTETEDYDYREFTKGWYISQMQQCLEELSFDTFLKVIEDDFDFPVDTLAFRLPANSFNLRGIWVYNGSIGVPSDSQRVLWKRGYYTRGFDKDFIAENKHGQQGPYIWPISETSESQYLWASVDNGIIQFSQSAASYSYIHLRYNGTLIPIGETPLIPQFFRQAVKLWVSLEFYRRMRKRNPRTYSVLFRDTHKELHAPFTGVWDIAMVRSMSLDSKARSDFKEYLSKMNY